MSLVGSYVALSKPLAAIFPVLLLAWLRFGIGAIAMLRWLRKPADEAPLSRRTQGLLFLESLFGNFLFTLCMVTGVSLTSAVTAGVTMAAIPAAVALMSWLFLRERVAARTWLAIALAVTGIGLHALSRPEADGSLPTTTSPQAWLGQVLLIGAVLCEAFYAVIGKRLTTALGPKRITSIVNLWGFVLSTPFGLYLAWRFDFGAVTAGTWGLLLFYALAACVWTVWLWMTGLRSVPASQAGTFTVLLPISAAVVGMCALGEQVSSMQALAFAIALLGILVATWPTRKQPAPPLATSKASPP
ncbi:putative DMT superfamily transporter inner membrane protein [Delftia tsuruhatensis]|nr:putative DMT superfamily transporter inner membrane protein [Delftia tsuruhatensis]CAC9681147.1 putative DMT superfamily transporter inner membrane protein [Delftia tsuruhatensis]